MNTNTIHYLTQEELKQLLAKVASKRGKALTVRACDRLYCSPTLTRQRAGIMFVKDWLDHRNIQNTIAYSQPTSKTRDEQARRVFSSPRIV
jgi:hypothetical protein